MADFKHYEALPFAKGTFAENERFTEVINFTLEKDPSKNVTFLPAHNVEDIPHELLLRMLEELNYVIEEGKAYPHFENETYEHYIANWFGGFHFNGILIEGTYSSASDPALLNQSKEFWDNAYLGHFFVRPNYMGRCSHVCNGGFMVNHNKRRLGLGKELGKKYLYVSPKLGYVYSVFNLVFETNIASYRIWESLGFEKLGYIKNAAVLKGESKFTGAYMFGKDLLELR